MHEEYLEKLPYWNDLSAAQKEFVRQNSALRKYETDAQLLAPYAECLGMLWVVKGDIRAYMLSEEGREITLFHLCDGESCVLSASCVIAQINFETQMTAEKDTEVLIVNSHAFARLAEENIYVKCFMYELISSRFSSVMWTMQQILFKGFDHRLASFLLSEYERTGSRDICMTHEQIARQTSSAREVVARMLKRFSIEGYVEFRRGVVTLKDISALKRI